MYSFYKKNEKLNEFLFARKNLIAETLAPLLRNRNFNHKKYCQKR